MTFVHGKRSKACTGKDKLTKVQAHSRVGKLRRMWGARVNAYRCSWCRLGDGSWAWHIGHRR